MVQDFMPIYVSHNTVYLGFMLIDSHQANWVSSTEMAKKKVDSLFIFIYVWFFVWNIWT